MASGIARSRFTTALGEALGLRKSVLYHRFERAGLKAPFTDLEAALKAVEADPSLLMKAKKFRLRVESDPAFRALVTRPQQTKTAPPKQKGNGKAEYKPQLIRRLTDIVVKEGETREAGRQRAWKILKDGGFKGKTLSWRDEAKAVECFRKAGVDMSAFVYLTTSVPSPGNGALVVAAPQALPTMPVPVFAGNIVDIIQLCDPKNREQVTEWVRAVEGEVTRMNTKLAEQGARLAELKAGADAARRAKTTLEQFQFTWFEVMGKREVPYGLNIVFDALADLTGPPTLKTRP